MASESDRSTFVEPLPARPNLEMQQKRAKDLARAAWAGEPHALRRIQALHPKPPSAADLSLADAQLVIARGYGFESWTAMRRKIESLAHTPVEQFCIALDEQDVDRLRELLAKHSEVRAAVNRPLWHFGGRPVVPAKKNLPLLDVLLQYGADINLKSDWWAGPFGILEYDCTPAEAAPLIERGAIVDIFAAAHLRMFDRVQELVEQDPSLVHARGGDGKTALHSAGTVEMARYLVERGAGLDVRCVDHESTPAQYLVREAPDVTRFLIERGAWTEIFMAISLGVQPLVERCLGEDAHVFDHRIGERLYSVAHDGKHASRPEDHRRGDIYRWVFGGSRSVIEVAARFGTPAIHLRQGSGGPVLERLLARATPVQQFLAACSTGNRPVAERLAAEHPRLVSTLTRDQQQLIIERVQADDLEAVRLMIDLGFDTRITGQDTGDALHWAAFLGNKALIELLLTANPALNSKDATHGGTALGWAIFGSAHGWRVKTGDFAGVAQLLIDAGERIEPDMLPTEREDLDRVLRARF